MIGLKKWATCNHCDRSINDDLMVLDQVLWSTRVQHVATIMLWQNKCMLFYQKLICWYMLCCILSGIDLLVQVMLYSIRN